MGTNWGALEMGIIIKENPRNIVIVTPWIVFKYRHDGNLRKIFWEFVLTWKAFLHGASEIPVLMGPILVRKTARGQILGKVAIEEVWENALNVVAELSRAGIEHKELRHPQYHMIVTKNGKISVLDFERGKLTKAPRNLSRFVVWLLERGLPAQEIKEALEKIRAPEKDWRGAMRAVERYLQAPEQDHQYRQETTAASH